MRFLSQLASRLREQAPHNSVGRALGDSVDERFNPQQQKQPVQLHNKAPSIMVGSKQIEISRLIGSRRFMQAQPLDSKSEHVEPLVLK